MTTINPFFLDIYLGDNSIYLLLLLKLFFMVVKNTIEIIISIILI